jgi:hypothetical protein
MRRKPKPTNAVTCACGETVFAHTTSIWIAIVDKEDGWLLEEYKWHAQGTARNRPFFAVSTTYARDKGVSSRLHRAIVAYVVPDHINRNGHDNRKCNLREGSENRR